MIYRYLSLITFFLVSLQSMAQEHFSYQGKNLIPGKYIYLVDPSKSTDDKAYVFNNVKDALMIAEAQKAKDDNQIDIYIAPSVYWMDNPDDETVVHRASLVLPAIGTKVNLSKVRLIGIDPNPENTVICTNRGDSFGADAQYDMFFWMGDDVTMENLTFGNYCSMDLVYKLKPELSHKQRTKIATRASIGMVRGDRYYFKNCQFFGRGAMQPFTGAERTLYENCSMECADNGLNPLAVYLNCKINLISEKPLHYTVGTGVVFLNCDFKCRKTRQCITRKGGAIAMVDCRFDNKNPNPIFNWSLKTVIDERNYTYNSTTTDGKPITWQPKEPQITVDMTGKEVLSAYKKADGTYNVENLLCGSDGWNPQTGQKTKVKREAAMLTLTQRNITIESETDEYKLHAKEYCYADIDTDPEQQPINWDYANEESKKLISLESLDNGKTCIVRGISTDDQNHETYISVSTSHGLCSACKVNLIPKQLPPPEFTESPHLEVNNNARTINLSYKLNLDAGLRDESVITWYRSAKNDSTKWFPVLKTYKNSIKTYPISEADNDCFVRAVIATKHQRCEPNENILFINTFAPIKSNYRLQEINTDFTTISGKVQPVIEKGLWTFDLHRPADVAGIKWENEVKNNDVFVYGEGTDGATGLYGFAMVHRGARMLYTPTGDKYGDMEISMNVAPFKNAGQGFGGSNMQYMDIFIKYDTKTQTGYALRIIRTKKFNGACDFQIMQYTNGIGKEVGNAVSATAFRRGCSINIKITGNQFTASVTNPDIGDPLDKGVPCNAELSTEITPNDFGGFGIQHTGLIQNASCLLQNMKVSWK